MPLSFPAARPHAVSPTRWRSRSRNQCPAQTVPAAAVDVHEAMEKLASADDIASAVRAAGIRAAGRPARPA